MVAGQEKTLRRCCGICSTGPLTLNKAPICRSFFRSCVVLRCSEAVGNAFVQSLIQRSSTKKEQLDSHWSRIFGTIGLSVYGISKSDAVLEQIQKIDHPAKKWIEIRTEGIAYIGSGNVLRVQKMSNEFSSGNRSSDVALLGYALIASSESIFALGLIGAGTNNPRLVTSGLAAGVAYWRLNQFRENMWEKRGTSQLTQ